MQFWDEKNPSYKKSISYKVAYVACLLLFVFLGYKWHSDLMHVMDILAADEAEYLRNGTALFQHIYKDWGPSYNIWYKLLSVFTNSKIELYYLNYTVTAVLATMFLFVVLERYDIHIIVALFISGMFFLSEINIETWPRVSHFVFIVLMLGLFIASYLKMLPNNFFICWYCRNCCLCKAEVRPFALIIFAMAFWVWYRQKTPIRQVVYILVVAFCLLLFFQIVYGSPAENYRGNVDRMYIAFCQHVAVNEFLHHDRTVDAMAGWRVYADKIFPACDTFTCILKTYPSAIFKNIQYNISNYLLTILNTLGSFLFPILLIKKKKLFLLICASLVLLFVACFAYKPFRQQLVARIQQHIWVFLSLFIIGIPTMMTSVLIFPRLHYLLCHIFLLIFILATFLTFIYQKLRIPNGIILVVMLLFVLIAPKASAYKFFRDNPDLGNMCGQKFIQHFNKDTQNTHVIFSDILNFSYLLPENYSDYSVEYDFKKGMQFEQVRQEKNIDIIFVNQNILKNPYLSKDSTWNHFLQHYETLGYEKKQVFNECNIYILQKK
ncbi:MAG: hypothetical protein R2807_03820 [Chitinophagales bacterium]